MRLAVAVVTLEPRFKVSGRVWANNAEILEFIIPGLMYHQKSTRRIAAFTPTDATPLEASRRHNTVPPVIGIAHARCLGRHVLGDKLRTLRVHRVRTWLKLANLFFCLRCAIFKITQGARQTIFHIVGVPGLFHSHGIQVVSNASRLAQRNQIEQHVFW